MMPGKIRAKHPGPGIATKAREARNALAGKKEPFCADFPHLSNLLKSLVLEPREKVRHNDCMKKTGNKGGKKQPPPQSRQDGALRIGRYVRWLYGEDTPPATLAELLIVTEN